MKLRWIALLSALAVAGTARGQETPSQEPPQPTFEQPGYTLSGLGNQPHYFDIVAGAIYTDNVLLAPTDKLGTGIATAGVDMDYDRVGSELTASAHGNVEWLEYFDNAFPGTPYGSFDGMALWGHPSDTFQWLVRDTLTEGATDPLAAPTPNVLEVINLVTTGPYLNLNLSSRDRGTLYGSFTATTYQRSPFDSKTYDGGALFMHGLSAISNIGLQIDSAHTSFEQRDIASDFTMRTAQAIFSGAYARTQVTASLGYAGESYLGTVSGAPYVTLDVTRRISPFSTVSLHGREGYTTLGGAVRSDIASPTAAPVLVGTAPAVVSAGPYKDRLVGAGWGFARARTSWSLQASNERQLYVSSALYNNETTMLSGSVQRRIRPTTFLILSAYRSYERFSNLNGKLTDTVVNASLVRRFRRFGVTIYAQRTHQVASANAVSAAGVATGSYDEDRAGIELSYDVIGQRFTGEALAPGENPAGSEPVP